MLAASRDAQSRSLAARTLSLTCRFMVPDGNLTLKCVFDVYLLIGNLAHPRGRKYSFKDKADKSIENDDHVLVESIRMFKNILAGNAPPPTSSTNAASSTRHSSGSAIDGSDPLASQIATISANIAAAIVQMHNQDENDDEDDEDEEDDDDESDNENAEDEEGLADGGQYGQHPVQTLQVSGVRYEQPPQSRMSMPSPIPSPVFSQHPEYTIFQNQPRNPLTDDSDGFPAPLRERKRKTSTQMDGYTKRKK